VLINFKALVVVLAVATIVFALAKPIWLRFTAPADFARRRTVWFVLTIVAFLSPSFWLYFLIAFPVVVWAGLKDSSPLALYLLLYFVIPPIYIPIPTVLINQLFAMSNFYLLAFAILVPAVWRYMATARRGQMRLHGLDMVLLLYGLLQLLLMMPYETGTNTLRRAFLFILGTYLVYFAFSRLLTDRHRLGDAMGGLCLSALLFAPIAAFESLRGWLLYTGIPDAWGQPNIFSWLFRAESLRAQVSTGHSITLGYILCMALGFWMYLKQKPRFKSQNVAFWALMCIGLYFTYARGPWAMALLVIVIAAALGSHNSLQLIKVSFVPVAVVLGILLSPLGGKFVEVLPFIGSADQQSVAQRQALAETSWRLVQQNPWFGNPFVLLDMEELRTGDNIIDLVNGYAQVALFYGLIGLALFMAVYLGAVGKSYGTFKRARAVGDAEMVWMGAALISVMVSSLFLMATSGQLYLQWVSAAMLVAYANLQVTEVSTSVSAVAPPAALARAGRRPSERPTPASS
jgi:hypothetical protein